MVSALSACLDAEMNFLTRLDVAEPFDTWLGMELATVERYWDGLALAANDQSRNTGAIYCFGYVVEMLLKAAYFRVIGIADTQDLGAGPLRTIYTLAEWHGRNLHDLQALVSLLIDRRRALGVPLDNVTAGEILWHALMVDSHWRETLRYKYTPALEDELHEVYIGAEWLFAHQELLWR